MEDIYLPAERFINPEPKSILRSNNTSNLAGHQS